MIPEGSTGHIAAVNTGAGGSATGTLSISGADSALHKLIDLQDELGDLSDEFWKLIRRVRNVESTSANFAAVKEVVDELDVEPFIRRVNADKQQKVIDVLRLVGSLAISTLKPPKLPI